jgi:hypothetical protein
LRRPDRVEQADDFFAPPDVIRDAAAIAGRHVQRLVNADDVVTQEVEDHGRSVIFDLA